jgi:hypothetical protein
MHALVVWPYLPPHIRSNTQSEDPFAFSTPLGRLPSLKLFMMNVSDAIAASVSWLGIHHALVMYLYL